MNPLHIPDPMTDTPTPGEGRADRVRAVELAPPREQVRTAAVSSVRTEEMVEEVHRAILGTPTNPGGLAGRVKALEDRMRLVLWLGALVVAGLVTTTVALVVNALTGGKTPPASHP